GLSVKKALKQNLIAYVPQSEDIDWDFPVLVEDVVLMGRYGHMNFFRYAREQDHEAVRIALERVNMLPFAKRQIGELSGGQKKRVFLARALAQQAKAILLDEPFTGVDIKTEDKIITLLQDLRKEGAVILVSTHNLDSVAEFCDRTILIKGTVVASGVTKVVFTQKNLEQIFGGSLRHHYVCSQNAQKNDIATDDDKSLFHDCNQKLEHIL
ncbi:MAG: ATP-binding cassette domain-containing protein, partial [Bartonella sp.]|nr:ATP-binding cassette domain-containing protein [Bartonella sp.]